MTDTLKHQRAFRAGAVPSRQARPGLPAFSAPYVLLADVSEFEPDIADAAYLQWSPAIVIRAAYGASHDDLAWYGGQRRALLHQMGAKFLGIYQYLVASQTGAQQALEFKRLVGSIQPGEVFIADCEEGNHALLTDWYNAMIATYGKAIAPWLWTYTGLSFGGETGLLPVQWIAAYQDDEPTTPHTLWQFTSAFNVPGVGLADCSVFHGDISELAALAYPVAPAAGGWGPPQNLTVRPGDGSVLVQRCDPPANATAQPDHYEVSVFTGSFPSQATLVKTYPRYMEVAPEQFGGLAAIPSGTHMTLRAVAYDAVGNASQYADVHFEMP